VHRHRFSAYLRGQVIRIPTSYPTMNFCTVAERSSGCAILNTRAMVSGAIISPGFGVLSLRVPKKRSLLDNFVRCPRVVFGQMRNIHELALRSTR